MDLEPGLKASRPPPRARSAEERKRRGSSPWPFAAGRRWTLSSAAQFTATNLTQRNYERLLVGVHIAGEVEAECVPHSWQPLINVDIGR